jgi:hypothetical protein
MQTNICTQTFVLCPWLQDCLNHSNHAFQSTGPYKQQSFVSLAAGHTHRILRDFCKRLCPWLQDRLNHSNRAYWPIQVVNRWLSVRLEMMGAFIVFITTVCVAVVLPTSAGIAGLAITSALNLTGQLMGAFHHEVIIATSC